MARFESVDNSTELIFKGLSEMHRLKCIVNMLWMELRKLDHVIKPFWTKHSSRWRNMIKLCLIKPLSKWSSHNQPSPQADDKLRWSCNVIYRLCFIFVNCCRLLDQTLNTLIDYSQAVPRMRGEPGGCVVQCSAHGLNVVSSILAHGSFLVRGVVLSLTLTELYVMKLPSSGGLFNLV